MKQWTVGMVAVVCAAGALAQACVGDPPANEGSPAEAGVDGDSTTTSGGFDASSSRLQLSVDDVTVLRGNSGVLQVRLAGVGGRTVSLRVLNRPSGFGTADEILAPANADSFEIPFQTDASTPYGQAELQVVASTDAGATTVTATARVMVRGVTGALDTSYGNGGTAEAPPGAHALHEALAYERGVLLVGATQRGPSYIDQRMTIARITDEGQLDTAFGDSGFIRWAPAPPVGENPQIFIVGSPIGVGALRQTSSGWCNLGTHVYDDSQAAGHFVHGICFDNEGVASSVFPTDNSIPVGGFTGLVSRRDGEYFVLHGTLQSGAPVFVRRHIGNGAVDSAWAGGSLALTVDSNAAGPVGPPADASITSAVTNTAIMSYEVQGDRLYVLLEGQVRQSQVKLRSVYSVLTVDLNTGTIIANAFINELDSRFSGLKLSRPRGDGTVEVSAPSVGGKTALYALSPEGVLSAVGPKTLEGGLVTVGATTGQLSNGRKAVLQYIEQSAWLHIVEGTGEHFTPSGGVQLDSFEASSNQSVLRILPSSADRVVLVFGSYHGTPGWALRRYWL